MPVSWRRYRPMKTPASAGSVMKGVGNALSMPYVRWISRRWCRPSHRRPHVFLSEGEPAPCPPTEACAAYPSQPPEKNSLRNLLHCFQKINEFYVAAYHVKSFQYGMRQRAGAACCVHDHEDARLTRLQCNTRVGKGKADDGGRHSGYYETWEHLSGPLRLIQ